MADPITDSSLLNFQNTIKDIEQAWERSKLMKRGVRGREDDSKKKQLELASQLKQDIVSILESPLLKKPCNLRLGLSADGIQALRTLHSKTEAIINHGGSTDTGKDLEVLVRAAVKLLGDPSLKAEAEEKAMGMLKESLGAGPSISNIRRSKRLAKLPQKQYDEGDELDVDFLLELEEEAEDQEDEDVEMGST